MVSGAENALRPECSVDFPQITEICERLEMQPLETKATVAVLAKALKDRRHPLRVKLKALTIANEMLYNPRAVKEFSEVENLQGALEVLRQARGGELGPAMDENVRMLATEIAVRCFERPPNERPSEANGWKSLTKAMSVDLEKARKGVHKNFQQFSQNAEKQIGKAERAFERSATMFLQEAENIFVGPSPSGPSGLGDRDRDDQGSRPQLTKEEEELQWALRASLDEARRSQASGDGHFLAEPAEARQGEPQGPQDSQRLREAKRRAQALEAQLEAKLSEDEEQAKLHAKVEAAVQLAERFALQISEAEVELGVWQQRRKHLEEELASSKSTKELRERLAGLEAKVALKQSQETRDGLAEVKVGKAGPEPHEEGQQGPLKDGAHADSDACGTCPATQPPSPVPHDVPGSSSSEAARSGAGEVALPDPLMQPKDGELKAELDTKMAEQKEREVIEVQKGPAAQQANPTYAVPEVDGKQGPTGQEPPELQPAEEEAEQQLEPSSSDGTHAADSEALGGIFPIVDTTQPPGSGSARDASPSSCSSSEAAGNARTTSEDVEGTVEKDTSARPEPPAAQPSAEEAEQQPAPSSSDGTHAADSQAVGGIYPIVDTTQPPGSGSARDASPSSSSSSESAGNARTTGEDVEGTVEKDTSARPGPPEVQPSAEEAEQQPAPSSSDGTHAADSEAVGGMCPIVNTTQSPGSALARDASPSSCPASEAAGSARTTGEV
ncbi:unnamed protein product [Effrenium voratum]|uniref:VHS domain-containing protein n=1 Tax=Effrenium voratum TaxID=2562239 RepID=A0AA36MKA8_9DINO|nr:unnamed protein product [Effrenium voratum]